MLKSACRWRPMSSWLLAWITWALPAAPGRSTTKAELWTWVLSQRRAEMGVLRIELWPFHIEECGGPPGLVLRQPLPWGPRFQPVPNSLRCPTAPNHSFLGSPNPDQHLRGRQTLAMMPPGPRSSWALSFPLFSTGTPEGCLPSASSCSPPPTDPRDSVDGWVPRTRQPSPLLHLSQRHSFTQVLCVECIRVLRKAGRGQGRCTC